MKRFPALVGAAILLTGSAAAQQIGPETGPPLPDFPEMSGPEYSIFSLDLPAGINLISSPLDTGSVPVRKAFEGVGSNWPYFYEWDHSGEQFLAPGDAPLTPSAGYWYYTPAPNTLMIFGQPYYPLSDLIMDIVPGWHLVGIPFLEGIDWQDFQLYAAGNPVGLETAMDLGWIGPSVLTMVGSEWQKHVVGQPFEPGLAYWIYTSVPLSLRATGSTEVLPESPIPPPPDVEPKWVFKLAKSTEDMVNVGEDVAEGKLRTGGFKGGGAVFGLANAAIQRYRYETIVDDLNGMDDKLDELLTDIAAVQNQLGLVEAEIEGLEYFITVESTLAPTLTTAKNWLDNFYYKVSETGTSYNWGRWSTAGCDLTQSTCEKEITDESIEAFEGKYVLDPENDPPTKSSDNFYLWWAYGVTGESGFKEFTQDGSSARNLVESIYSELTFSPIGITLPLQAYMEYIFSQSGCATDVTNCDLYAEVYEPVEAFFQQLVAYQVNLVQAIVDAYSVLASTEQNQTTHTYDNSISDYLTAYDGFIHQLANEAENFLQVAEQIALYRAADSRFDWSTFGTTDAAQLLARADFVAAQLAAPAGRGEPWPWPPGVTGRIFYTQQHTLPSPTYHQACQAGSTICTALTEITPEYAVQPDGTNSVTGDWPYLQWVVPSNVDAAVGTPTQKWQIRRLEPQPLAAGTYQVAREYAEHFSLDSRNANLVVAEYGSDYSNPPTDPSDAVLFGSFNSLEGMGVVNYRAIDGGKDDSMHDFNWTWDYDSTTMSVTYKTDTLRKEGDWYQRDYFQLAELPTSHGRVQIRWPATISIGIGSQLLYGTPCSGGFYHTLAQSLKVLEPDNDVVPGTDNLWNLCGTDIYKCNISYEDRNGPMKMETGSLTLKPGTTYQLRAHFNDVVDGYTGSYTYVCEWGATPGSKVTWKLFNPTFTLTK